MVQILQGFITLEIGRYYVRLLDSNPRFQNQLLPYHGLVLSFWNEVIIQVNPGVS